MNEIKAVIDSNVLVSILKGSPALSPIYSAFKENLFKLVISADIMRELAAVLYRPHLQINSDDIKELFKAIRMKSMRVDPKIRIADVCRDAKDNIILEVADEANADFIVTGDKDLLELSVFRGISIITPKEFISHL